MVFVTSESLDRLIDAIPSEANREFARSFMERKRANGRKDSTLASQLNHVRAWGEFLGKKRFDRATEADVREFLLQRKVMRRWRPKGAGEVEKEVTIKDSTVELRKVVLKSFQAHVHKRGKRDPRGPPPEVAWLEARPRNNDDEMPVDPSDLITRKELLAMIESHEHPQVKAILATLYDSGMRASEFCSLKIKHVQMDEFGAVLSLERGRKNLKTGARMVRILQAHPYLLPWLNAHPHKGNPNAALWLTLTTNGKGQPLRPGALGRLVHRAAKDAKLGEGRRVWPHLFRHSRATECAKEGMTEMEMRIHFGWSKTSDMPAKYIHLSGGDVDKAMLRRAGKVEGGTKFESALKPRVCLCGYENKPDVDFCEKAGCGRPLTVKVAEVQMDKMADLILKKAAEKAERLARS